MLPRLPDQLLPTAIHMSGVSFFWEAPAAMAPAWGGRVPWAVTANLAVKLSAAARFKEGFPGAGGHSCLRTLAAHALQRSHAQTGALTWLPQTQFEAHCTAFRWW